MPKRITRCKSCHRQIFWAVTIHGKSTPMDPEHRCDGGWVIEGETDQGAPRVRAFEPITDGDAPRFTPHWATCPNADQHRKR